MLFLPLLLHRFRGEAKTLARLLGENPDFSKADVEEAVEYFKHVVDNKVDDNYDARKEYPEMNYKKVRVRTRCSCCCGCAAGQEVPCMCVLPAPGLWGVLCWCCGPAASICAVPCSVSGKVPTPPHFVTSPSRHPLVFLSVGSSLRPPPPPLNRARVCVCRMQ